jgi:crossover junction endodeoxyribonuclease RuvC
MSVLISIDPGAISGAYAIFGRAVVVGDLPVVDGQLDAASLSRLLSANGVVLAVVEKVGAMPKQGVASTFKFGYACGVIYGVLAANNIPVHYVTPRKWKGAYGLGADKEAARAVAIHLFPQVEGLALKKHHGRAEALLLGEWFRKRSNDI